MISDEAVEAAAKALWDVDRTTSDREYEDCRDGTKRHLRREVRAVIEAAAPYMLEAVEKVRKDLFEMSNERDLTTQARAAYRDASRAIREVQ